MAEKNEGEKFLLVCIRLDSLSGARLQDSG